MIEPYLGLRPTFARHETFHPRFGWLKKAANAASEDEAVFTAEDATVRLGVGKNMVRAIRFWGRAFGVLREAAHPGGGRHTADKLTAFGASLFHESAGWDPYLEEPGSLWLLHWNLLRPPCSVPVWSVAFNTFAPIEFREDELVGFVVDALSGWTDVAESSIGKDVDCLLRMYAPRTKARDALEDQLDSPFRELSLIDALPGASRSYRFSLGSKPTLPDALVAYASLEFCEFSQSAANTISVARLASAVGAPGRVFKLTESALGSALERFVDTTSLPIQVTAPAGLRQLAFDGPSDRLAIAVLEEFYATRVGVNTPFGGPGRQALIGEVDDELEATSDVERRLLLAQRKLELTGGGR